MYIAQLSMIDSIYLGHAILYSKNKQKGWEIGLLWQSELVGI